MTGRAPTTREATHPGARGRVRCRAFPIVVITSNGEREFPPAFLRRCLRLEMAAPEHEQLATSSRRTSAVSS